MTRPTIYITTPLYYVNDELHIGHATTTLFADTLARFKRLDGYDVTLLTGSDEHGQKIFDAAKKVGKTPKELADGIVGKFKEVWQVLGISEHEFIRTTEPWHELTVKSLFARLKERGMVYKGVYKALYCKECETAYTASQLLDGKCPVHKTEPAHVDEENYFFKLSACHELLRTRLADETLPEHERLSDITPDATSILPPQRRNEILGKVREGLEDVSISRTTFDWGVSMPGDPDHVIWVWFDALIGYMSSQIKPDPAQWTDSLPDLSELAQTEPFKRNWPVVIHLVGKDILWHHSVVWWSMLYQAGLQLPRKVFAHGWWSVEGDKMSKTLGNVIRPGDVVAKYGRDAIRWFVLREGPGRADADWRHERFISVQNTELANELGNLLSRTLGMLGKYRSGVVPAPVVEMAAATRLQGLCHGLPERLRTCVDAMDFARATDALLEVIRACNLFIDESAPFKLAKDSEKAGELDTVMHALLQTLRVLSVALEPFLPEAAERMKVQLNVPANEFASATSPLEAACVWQESYVGRQTTKGEGLFPRRDEPAESST